jgi:hypothetical protein
MEPWKTDTTKLAVPLTDLWRLAIPVDAKAIVALDRQWFPASIEYVVGDDHEIDTDGVVKTFGQAEDELLGRTTERFDRSNGTTDVGERVQVAVHTRSRNATPCLEGW